MDTVTLQQELRAFAREAGIDKIGFTTADPFREMKNRLRRQQEAGFQSGFEKGSLEERTDPALLLEEPESIIAIAVAYPSKLDGAPKGSKGARRGMFCRASWGQDYHDVLKEKLALLEAFIPVSYTHLTLPTTARRCRSRWSPYH